MDSFKLVIFLAALVAACNTLGSPVTEKDLKEMSPETKEIMRIPAVSNPNELDKPEETDDRSPVKRVDPGTVIAGVQLGAQVLTQILNVMGSIKRKIAIGIENKTGHKWNARNVYFLSGTSDVAMPREVPSGEALLYTARKTSGSARGVVGVMAYYIPAIRKTLAVMFSVSYDYNWYSNWWNVKLYSGERRAQYDIYSEMYYGYPSKGDNGWHDSNLQGSGLKSHGLMTSSGTPTLEIHVYKA